MVTYPPSPVSTPAVSRPRPSELGIEPMAMRAWVPVDRSAVVAPDHDVVLRPIGRDGPGSFEKVNATLQEVGLEDGRHLGILLGQNLLAAHDERDLTTRATRTGARTPHPVTPDPMTTTWSGSTLGG